MSKPNSTKPQRFSRTCQHSSCKRDISHMRAGALYCSQSCRTRSNYKYEKKGSSPKKGTENPSSSPVGTRRKTKSGYITIKTETGFRPEHSVIMESAIGRPLRKGETVHHRNGVKDDNRLQNLELWSSSHHPGQRVSDLVSHAVEILEIYGEDYGFEVVKKTPVGPLWNMG